MLYAVISDIHANAEALSVVLNDIEKRKPDVKVCLGDIVGYCAAPVEAVSLIKSFDTVLIGNHDLSVSKSSLLEKFNFHARLAIEETNNMLSLEEKEYLSNLEYIKEDDSCTFVHSSPRHPKEFGYVMNIDDAMDSFNYFSTQFCFIGHTHFPIIVSDKGEIIKENKITFKKNQKYIINVGSVGQPRDNDPRACYCLFDSDKKKLEYIRLDYDIEATQKTMRKAKFPHFLINRLVEGR